LLWVVSSQIELWLPWYALQLAALAWVAVWSSDILRRHLSAEDRRDEKLSAYTARLRLVVSLLSSIWPLAALLSVCEWGLHSLLLVGSPLITDHLQWHTTQWRTTRSFLVLVPHSIFTKAILVPDTTLPLPQIPLAVESALQTPNHASLLPSRRAILGQAFLGLFLD